MADQDLMEAAKKQSGEFEAARSVFLQSAVDDVYKKYPILSQYGFEVAYGERPEGTVGGLEFYAPDEEKNPRPGVPFIEVYDRSVTGNDLATMLFGDMLHHVASADDGFRAMRDKFVETITPEQAAIDRGAYERSKLRHGESRSFDKWFDVSRKDAYIRGYLAPDKNDEWRDIYTDEQKKILEQMKSYLGVR